jgi:WD40 repeat protein/serine/threonine protein kinase
VSGCPSREELALLLAEQLSEAEIIRIEDHLEACTLCQKVLAELTDRDPAEREGQSPSRPMESALEPSPEFMHRLKQNVRDDSPGPRSTDPITTAPLTPTGPAEADATEVWPQVTGYEILAELGQGGMGVVYQARHRGLNRLVALKMIRGDVHINAQWRARFQAEARVVAGLQHPNIVQVYEVGEVASGGGDAPVKRPFFSLEFIAGGSLDHKLARQPQPARAAAELVETVARAVHVVHQHGLVHRDLKPANILLTPDGTPKITDFGLVKQLDGAMQLTHTGMIMGTPCYMAPEQVRANPRDVGPAADVYALGTILYQMLTGRPPFQGETAHDVLLQVTHAEPVAPRRLLPQVPRDLETICLKCLHKEPRRRYASALDLAEDLRRFRQGEPILARPIGPWERARKWAQRRPAVAALSAVVVGVSVLGFGLVTWKWLEAEAAYRQAETASRAKVEAQTRATEERLRKEAALERAEEGRRANYFATLSLAQQKWAANDVRKSEELLDDCPADLRGWEWHLLKRRSRSGQFAFRADAAGVGSVAFSPDGKYLASGAGRMQQSKRLTEVKVWEASTGKLLGTLKGHVGPVTGVAFSPDGKLLASVSTRVNWPDVARAKAEAMNTADGEMKIWDPKSGAALHTFPGVYGNVAFSPDGTRLAASASDRRVQVWDTTTAPQWTKVAALPPYPGLVQSLAFSPDGKRLATARVHFLGIEGGKAKFEADLKTWEAATGQEERTFEGHEGELLQLAYSPDGRRLAVSSSDGITRIWDLTAKSQPLVLRGHSSSVPGLAFSPDGRCLATTGKDRAVKVWDPASGEESFTLRGHTGQVRAAAFDPQGKGPARRLITAGDDGMVRVWDAYAGQEPLALRGHAGLVTWVAFSPDGRRLASRGAGGSIKVWDLASAKELFAINCQAERVVFSPDGQRLLTAGGAPQSGELKVWDAEKGRPLATLTGHALFVTSAAFSPDGRWIASASGNPIQVPPQAGEVKIWDAATYREVLSFQPSIGCVASVAFSPDGRQLALASMDKVVQIRETATGEPVRTFRGHKGMVICVAFSPDGRHLGSGDSEGITILWDLATGEQTRTFLAHAGSVFGLAFNPSGSRLATASLDELVTFRGEVRIWDVHSGHEAITLPGQLTVAFSPDGNRLAAAGVGNPLQPGVIRVWDATPNGPQALPRTKGGTDNFIDR